ncbi:hypothetical protein GCM10010420_14940 [Streptomyces glaucosporus]|uniref:Uncharacterized protein n=1 Tax=Streptomyces glaucosporus TaxID=284044 RepID=A0ABN3I1P6_9ACTN
MWAVLPFVFLGRGPRGPRGRRPREDLTRLVARAPGEAYFQDGGSRAAGLEAHMWDVDYIEFRFRPHGTRPARARRERDPLSDSACLSHRCHAAQETSSDLAVQTVPGRAELSVTGRGT